MNKPCLTVANLNFCRGNKALLKQVAFALHSGELVGIIGPNGAGKSTLLKCLVGIHRAAQGQIIVDQIPLSQLSHQQRAQKMSYLAQRQESAFPFTVADTIKLGAHAWVQSQTPKHDNVTAQLMSIANDLDINHLLARRLDELSGGETQLVHFARILMQNTPILLLDEPTAALDIGHEAQLMNLLRQQCHAGKAALVAIHNLNIAAAFCDRLLLLDQGELIACGRPDDVITQQQISSLYSNQVMVSQHPLSGTVTVLPMPERQTSVPLKVHLIGGAGSTVALARTLLHMGIDVTAGIGHEQDSDTDYWQATGIKHVKVPAFSPISGDSIEQASRYVQQADITILTEFPIGAMNVGNLDLARHANTLWLLEETDDQRSRFYQAEMHGHYQQLKAQATVYNAVSAIEQLNRIVQTLIRPEQPSV